MKIVIEYNPESKEVTLQSDGPAITVLGILEIARWNVIKEGLERKGLAGFVRKVDVGP